MRPLPLSSLPSHSNGIRAATIKFKAAGSADWISYEGDRSFESLVEFLDANAGNDINTPDEAAPAASEAVKADHHDEL